jgi:hypothetical protein
MRSNGPHLQVSEVEKNLQDLVNGVVDETLPRLTEEG